MDLGNKKKKKKNIRSDTIINRRYRSVMFKGQDKRDSSFFSLSKKKKKSFSYCCCCVFSHYAASIHPSQSEIAAGSQWRIMTSVIIIYSSAKASMNMQWSLWPISSLSLTHPPPHPHSNTLPLFPACTKKVVPNQQQQQQQIDAYNNNNKKMAEPEPIGL